MDNILQISAAALAYLGDSVLELMVRERLILAGIEKPGRLNEEARKYITAVSQSIAYLKIKELLSPEEEAICRRARNSSHLNIPKSASGAEYKNATSLEALFGYLHLSGKKDRINELFTNAYGDLT